MIVLFELIRLHGYANCSPLKKIKTDDFEHIEQFVREQLLECLKNKCERTNSKVNSDEMEYFLGMFSDNVKDFKIMRGERYLLEEIAEYLNDRHDSLGRATFHKHFEPPKKYRVSNEDIIGIQRILKTMLKVITIISCCIKLKILR